jgi:hypothetical protein
VYDYYAKTAPQLKISPQDRQDSSQAYRTLAESHLASLRPCPVRMNDAADRVPWLAAGPGEGRQNSRFAGQPGDSGRRRLTDTRCGRTSPCRRPE